MRHGILALAALVVALLPLVGAQQPVDGCARQCSPTDPDVNDPPLSREGPVNVVLYAHMDSALFSGALNTLPPHPAEPEMLEGFLMPTMVVETGAPAGTVNFDNNGLRLTSCPGTVEMTPRGMSRNCHSGVMGGDLLLTGDPVTAYLYVSFGTVGGAGSPAEPGSPTPHPVPLLGLRGEVHTGFRGEDPGNVVARGDTGAQPAMIVANVEGHDVYELRLEMEVLAQTIPQEPEDPREAPGFVVLLEAYQVHGDGVEFMQSGWRVHGGPRFPNRILLPLANPLEGRGLVVERQRDHLMVEAAVGTPLGSYDIDLSTLALRVEAGGDDVLGAELVDLRHSTDHDGVHRPTVAQWNVPLEALPTAGGPLAVRVSAQNVQGTFLLEQVVEYDVPPLQPASVDSIAFAAGLAALAVASAARRR